MTTERPSLLWLEPGDAFPEVDTAWGASSPAPGLLAAGGDLEVDTLCRAYAQGVFPWFSAGQPTLWWSTDPRMVLRPQAFRLHRSLRKTLARLTQTTACEVRFDSAFERVIGMCAGTQRRDSAGTWIVPEMQSAYTALHHQGLAHSVETWMGGELVGGLYCVALGRAVFGESMFSLRPDASKIALAALVAFCLHHGVTHIDCQQNTSHLASLGAREMPRAEFLRHVRAATAQPELDWNFNALYWTQLLHP